MDNYYTYVFKCNCVLEDLAIRPPVIKYSRKIAYDDNEAILKVNDAIGYCIDEYLYDNIVLISILRPNGTLLTGKEFNYEIDKIYRKGIREGERRERDRINKEENK